MSSAVPFPIYEQGAPGSQRQQIVSRWNALVQDRESWMPHWREISDYIQPRRGMFLSTKRQNQRGSKMNTKIVNNAAGLAARTLASGMLSGLTSPARPWFRLTTPDPDLAEFRSVKLWIQKVQQRMELRFSKSNLYKVLPSVYYELGCFGVAPMLMEDDPKVLFRFRHFTVGSYALANNARLQTDTLYRELQMTARQMVEFFGHDAVSRRVSDDSRNAPETWHDVLHAIYTRPMNMPGSALAKHKPIASCWIEVQNSERELLRESGFDELPIMVPKWAQVAEDVYGSLCPGFDALYDTKQLQLIERRKLEALDKMVKPPMVGPASLKERRPDLTAGGMTYINALQGAQKFERAFDMNFPLGDVREEIAVEVQRIDEAFYKQLFLAIAMDARNQRATAREIEEIHGEKLLMLGPVLEGMQEDLLDPLIDRAFEKMLRAGEIPTPPDELRGTDLKVEYISILAQAQRSVGVASLERTAAFILGTRDLQPDVVDKWNGDQSVDEFAQMVGTPPGAIRTDDEVEEIRGARARAQQRAQAIAESREQAEQAKLASEAQASDGTNVLDQIMAGQGGGPVPGGPVL